MIRIAKKELTSQNNHAILDHAMEVGLFFMPKIERGKAKNIPFFAKLV
ncbi:MAG: hypothetical protein SO019_07040 [Lachnospiraceae bacterium]|nr:hypothetical protein [Lachnospiraceae bacterium]